MATKVQTTRRRVVGWMRAARAPDQLSYLWLALGIVLLPFATPRWTIPLAAWLYPVFLLRFVRTQPLSRGILLVALATVLAFSVAAQGVILFPGAFYALIVVGFGVVFTLPYLLDRVLTPRLQGVVATLVFPSAMTTLWYLNGVFNPYGADGNPAYTQYGNLPLLQLLSVTGLWGLIFVMSWFAALVNWAWERGFAWPQIRGGVGLYASLLAVVLLFGGARLTLLPVQAGTVRVAGISPSPALIAAFGKRVSHATQVSLVLGTGTQADRALVRQASAPVYTELLALSLQEARAGAKIIVWPECSGTVDLLQEDEAGLLAKVSALARTTGTYLDLGLCEFLQHPVQSRFFADEIVLLDPTGRVVWRYQKVHPYPGDGEPAGDGQVPSLQTPYGRLANVVCFDADFPSTMHQAGQAGVDVMLVPSNDWRAIDPYSTQRATFRAIENGYALVRQDSNGLSMAVDAEGQVLASTDYFTTDPQVLVAYVPKQGVHTIYATIGDLFAWLSIAGLVVLIGVGIAGQRTTADAEAT